MSRVARFRSTVLRRWQVWLLKKRMVLAARELEYATRLAQHAEMQGHVARRDLAYLECPPTIYDCRAIVVPRPAIN